MESPYVVLGPCIVCDQQLTGSQRKYCSRHCRNSAVAAVRQATWREKRAKQAEDRKKDWFCIQCSSKLAGTKRKFCSRACTQAWWDANPEVKERKKAYSKYDWETNPEKCRRSARKHHYKKTFGMTEEEYASFVAKPCEICGTVEVSRVVDHSHVTGEVRGALCSGCNTGLGNFRDTIALLESAIKYLRKRGV